MEDGKKFDRDEWVAKIEKLLKQAESYDTVSKAGSPANPEMAAQLRAKAEQLMNRYRVEEEELREATPAAQQMAPTVREFRVCRSSSPYVDQYLSMGGAAAYHSGCRTVSFHRDGDVFLELVGFEIDTRYAEMLILNATVVFAAHLEPSYDPSESEAENIYRLRRSGVSRRDIAVKLWGLGKDRDGAAHGKVQKVYEAECAKRGETPISGRGFVRTVYAEQYAKQFVSTLRSRLYRARTAAGLNQAGEMVLANRAERVDEAFYERYPYFRPTTPGTDVSTEVETPEQKKARLAREAKAERDAERFWAEQARKAASPAGRAGSAAGKKAAEKVALRGTTSAGHLGEGS